MYFQPIIGVFKHNTLRTTEQKTFLANRVIPFALMKFPERGGDRKMYFQPTIGVNVGSLKFFCSLPELVYT